MFNTTSEDNSKIEKLAEEMKSSQQKDFLINTLKLSCISIFYMCLLFLTYSMINPLSTQEWKYLENPSLTSEYLFDLLKVLKSISNNNSEMMILLLSVLFFSFQSLGLPGSLYPMVLMPMVMDPVSAFLYVNFLTMVSSLACYFIYQSVGKPFMVYFASKRLAWFQVMLENNQDDLWYYFFFVRTSPLMPNVLVNICFGVSEVPLKYVCVVNFLGILPTNLFWTYAGTRLADGEIVNPFSVLVMMMILSMMAIMPKLINFVKQLGKGNACGDGPVSFLAAVNK